MQELRKAIGLNQDIWVSFVVPARNEGKYLHSCLKAIRLTAKNNIRYEIIVVDNGSTDDTIEIAKGSNCRTIKNQKMGAASSRNVGARLARGRFLAFIDADCTLDKNWLEILSEHFEDENVVAAGTKIAPDFNNATWVEKIIFLLNNRRGKNISKKVMRVKWIGSSNMLIKKDIFDKIGGFNDNLITCEDFDICAHLARLGDIILDKRIYTTHLKGDRNLKILFIKELWRGQDSFKQWSKAKFKANEALSIIVPVTFLISLVVNFFVIIFNFLIGISLLLLAILLPIIMVARSRYLIFRPILFFQGIIVSCVYLTARGVSFLKEIYHLFSGNLN